MTMVNLLDWRRCALRRILKRWLWLSVALTLLVCFALLAWRLHLAGNTRQWQKRLVLWQQATQQVQQLTLRYEEAQMRARTLRQQADSHQRKRQRLAQWQAFLLQLEESIPDDLWLSSLTQQQLLLRLDGLSLRPEATRQLRYRLGEPPFLQPWQPGSVKRSPDGFYHFMLAAQETTGVEHEK